MNASRTPSAPTGHKPEKAPTLRVLARGTRLYVDPPKPRHAAR
jgi:hypothetical protein